MAFRILHINSYLKDRTFYKGLFEEQIREGNKVMVFTPVPYGNRGKADSVGKYVNVEECYYQFERILFFLKQKKSIVRAEKLYDFSSVDIIHAHSMCTNGYIAYRISKKYKIPYIITVRNGDLNNIYKKAIYLRPIFNKIIKHADKVVFLSESYKQDVVDNCVPVSMKKDLLEKSRVIPNGIDNFWIENVNKFEHTIHKPLRLIYAGEINKNKNIETLVGVIKELNKETLNAKLTICGTIKDELLEPLIKTKNVCYRGTVNKEKLKEIYRDNDIFVMVSKKEAFGLVYAEAMSQGLPIIYTKNQGFDKQFPEGQVGYHVECNSADEIISAIKQIANNYSELSSNCIRNVKKFRWMEIASLYGRLYNEVCRNL